MKARLAKGQVLRYGREMSSTETVALIVAAGRGERAGAEISGSAWVRHGTPGGDGGLVPPQGHPFAPINPRNSTEVRWNAVGVRLIHRVADVLSSIMKLR